MTSDQTRPSPSGIILFYHGVTPRPSGDPVERFLVSLDEFRRHLDYFQQHFRIVSLTELLQGEQGSSELPPLVLTFDDALRCFYDHGVPELEARKLPFTVSVPSALIGQDRPLWSLELFQLILGCEKSQIELDFGRRRRRIRLGTHKRRSYVAEALHLRLLHVDDSARARTLSSLRCNFGEREHEELCGKNPALGIVGVDRLLGGDQSLVEFAVHGKYHIPLHGGEADSVLIRETRTAKSELEKSLGRTIDYFCFPYGTSSWPAMEALEYAGYRAVLGTEPQAYAPEDHEGPLPLLPRICAERTLDDLRRLHESGWAVPEVRSRPRWLTFPLRAARKLKRAVSPI